MEDSSNEETYSEEEEKTPAETTEKKHHCHKGKGLPPRNALKKLIARELEKTAP